MKRPYPAAVAAVLMLAVWSDSRAQPPACPVPSCPTCVYGPHKETVKKTVYGTKEEPFCLQRLSLLKCFTRGGPCGGDECLPPRTKTRLVKWDVTHECVKMKCAVEQPTVVPTPHHPPR